MNWNTIQACIETNSLLKHPFYLAWSAGELTVEDLSFYATQYYALETTFPRLLSRIHSQCESPDIQQQILENLMDEQHGKDNHRELWLRFAEGLSLSRNEVIGAPLSPATEECIKELMSLASDPNPALGLSMLYAYESQLPKISESKIQGLKRFYGIDSPETLQFFTVHQKVDIWHAEEEKNMITSLIADIKDIHSAVERSCKALWRFLDGVYEVVALKVTCTQTV